MITQVLQEYVNQLRKSYVDLRLRDISLFTNIEGLTFKSIEFF